MLTKQATKDIVRDIKTIRALCHPDTKTLEIIMVMLESMYLTGQIDQIKKQLKKGEI